MSTSASPLSLTLLAMAEQLRAHAAAQDQSAASQALATARANLATVLAWVQADPLPPADSRLLATWADALAGDYDALADAAHIAESLRAVADGTTSYHHLSLTTALRHRSPISITKRAADAQQQAQQQAAAEALAGEILAHRDSPICPVTGWRSWHASSSGYQALDSAGTMARSDDDQRAPGHLVWGPAPYNDFSAALAVPRLRQTVTAHYTEARRAWDAWDTARDTAAHAAKEAAQAALHADLGRIAAVLGGDVAAGWSSGLVSISAVTDAARQRIEDPRLPRADRKIKAPSVDRVSVVAYRNLREQMAALNDKATALATEAGLTATVERTDLERVVSTDFDGDGDPVEYWTADYLVHLGAVEVRLVRRILAPVTAD